MLHRTGAKLGGAEYQCTYVSEQDLTALLDSLDLTGKECGIDIETYPLSQHKERDDAGLLPVLSLIRTVQIFDGSQIWILDLMGNNGKLNFLELGARAFAHFSDKVLRAPAKLYAHSALFETSHFQKYAYRYDLYTPLDIYCSMNAYRLVAHALYAFNDVIPCKADLKTVADAVLGIGVEKESQTSDWSASVLSEQQILYCARDAVLPYAIHKTLEPRLEELGLWQVHDLNRNVQEALAHMNVHGVCINAAKHQELIDKWRIEEQIQEAVCKQLLNKHIPLMESAKLLELLSLDLTPEFQALLPSFDEDERTSWIEQLFALLKEATDIKAQITGTKGIARTNKLQLNKLIRNIENLTIDLDSSKQLGSWLEQNLSLTELEKWPRTEKGKALKTDISAFLEAGHLDIVKPIVAYRKHTKLVSTYGEGFQKFAVEHFDGTVRIHPNFTLCKTDTGRMSSYEPNVQNIPGKGIGEEIRSIFITRPGDRTFVTADFSQIELRIAAELSRDEVLLAAYENGLDIHTLTASRILNKPFEEITKDERKNAKAPNFLLIYGGGPATLMKGAKKDYGINMTLEEGQFIVNAFRDAYPGLYRWQQKMAFEGQRDLFSNTALGKLRKLDKDRSYNVSMNHPIQGGAAELMLLSAVFVLDEILQRKLDCYLVNIVHDEFDLDCHTSCAEEVKGILKASMERSMAIVYPGATHRDLVGISSGANWQLAK